MTRAEQALEVPTLLIIAPGGAYTEELCRKDAQIFGSRFENLRQAFVYSTTEAEEAIETFVSQQASRCEKIVFNIAYTGRGQDDIQDLRGSSNGLGQIFSKQRGNAGWIIGDGLLTFNDLKAKFLFGESQMARTVTVNLLVNASYSFYWKEPVANFNATQRGVHINLYVTTAGEGSDGERRVRYDTEGGIRLRDWDWSPEFP